MFHTGVTMAILIMLVVCFERVETCTLSPIIDYVTAHWQLLLSRYTESSQVLYQQNTLEFDHPMSLGIFSAEVSPSSLQNIRSISIDMHRYVYVNNTKKVNISTNLQREQWLQTWNIISTMQGLEEVRVRFQLLIDGWMGWTEKEILDPLYNVRQVLKVFEVDMPLSSVKTSSRCDGEERHAPFKLIQYWFRLLYIYYSSDTIKG